MELAGCLLAPVDTDPVRLTNTPIVSSFWMGIV